jgi:hypothetical protein
VPQTSQTPLSVSEFSGCDKLSAESRRLFADVHTRAFQSSEWWEHFQQHGLAGGDRLPVFVAEGGPGHAPVALFPVIFSRLHAAHPRARVLHFLGSEGMPYEPILAPDCDDAGDAVESLIGFLRNSPRPYDVLRFSPLDSDSPILGRLLHALHAHRFRVQVYQIQDDRYETTAGHSSADYLAARPRSLRERLGSTGRMLFASGRASFALVREPSDVDVAWPDCERLLVEADETTTEVFDYLPRLLRIAANAGVLRLGLIALDGEPAAMQLWVIAGNVAHCLRIVQSPRISELPLDDVLTERIVPFLIDDDRVVELDFGYIVEQFAADWAPRTRRRLGVIAFNAGTRRGFKGAMRHIVLPRLLALPRRVWRKLRAHA